MTKPYVRFAHQEVHVPGKRALHSVGKCQLQRMANTSYHYQVRELPLTLHCLENTVVDARIHRGVVNSNAEETLCVKSHVREEVFQCLDDCHSSAIVQIDEPKERCHNALLSSTDISHHYAQQLGSQNICGLVDYQAAFRVPDVSHQELCEVRR